MCPLCVFISLETEYFCVSYWWSNETWTCVYFFTTCWHFIESLMRWLIRNIINNIGTGNFLVYFFFLSALRLMKQVVGWIRLLFVLKCSDVRLMAAHAHLLTDFKWDPYRDFTARRVFVFENLHLLPPLPDPCLSVNLQAATIKQQTYCEVLCQMSNVFLQACYEICFRHSNCL